VGVWWGPGETGLSCDPGMNVNRFFSVYHTTQTYIPEKWNHACTKTCTLTLTATLFRVEKHWTQPKCPLVGEWLDQLQNIHTVKFCSETKMSGWVIYIKGDVLSEKIHLRGSVRCDSIYRVDTKPVCSLGSKFQCFDILLHLCHRLLLGKAGWRAHRILCIIFLQSLISPWFKNKTFKGEKEKTLWPCQASISSLYRCLQMLSPLTGLSPSPHPHTPF
jgi:hypothetical protein